MKCITCTKQLEYIIRPYLVEDGRVINEYMAGGKYESKTLHIAICNDCLDKHIEEGTILTKLPFNKDSLDGNK